MAGTPPLPGAPRGATISVAAKPGIQALAPANPALPPVPGVQPEVGRDYEYARWGTASILADVDLPAGRIIARVERRPRSGEFVGLLKDLDLNKQLSRKRTQRTHKINYLQVTARSPIRCV
jgi:hypothetical protein